MCGGHGWALTGGSGTFLCPRLVESVRLVYKSYQLWRML